MAMLATASIAVTACDDTLDVDSPSSQDATFVYSSTEHATKALNSVYVLFCEDPFTSRMSNVWMQNTDIEVSAPSEGSPAANDRRSIWGLQSMSCEGWSDIYKAWNNCLQAIDRANQVIQGVDNSSIGSTDEMQQIKGEAIALKAYRYLLMCNFWGDVPYYDVPASWGEDIDKGRTDKFIIYSKILQELVNIEPNMKWSDVNTGGIERVTRDYAIGLIAKIAMFRAGYGKTVDNQILKADDYLDVTSADLTVTYTNKDGVEVSAQTAQDYYTMALDYALKLEQLKGRDLNTNFYHAFENNVNYVVENNSEVLYEVAFVESYGGDVGWCFGVTNTGTCAKGNTTNQVGIAPTLFQLYAKGDQRRDITCAYWSHNSDTIVMSKSTALAVGKWDRALAAKDLGSSSSKGTGINFPLMRYSEVLLIAAEAANELGDVGTAQTYLKKVRARAFNGAENYSEQVDNYVAALSNHDDMFNAIVDERAFEFAGEGLRRFDLIRWGNYAQKIEQTLKQMVCWGISTNEDLMNNEDVDASLREEAKKYLTWPDVMYYINPNRNKSNLKADITLLSADERKTKEVLDEEYDNVYSVAWGTALLKTVKTYEYEGAKYTTCTKTTTTNTETGIKSTKYELSGNESGLKQEFTIADGEDSNVTQVNSYQSGAEVSRYWRGYINEGTLTGNGIVPYLLPIATTTLNASSTLTNDGYGLVINSNVGAGVEYAVVKKENY